MIIKKDLYTVMCDTCRRYRTGYNSSPEGALQDSRKKGWESHPEKCPKCRKEERRKESK